MAWEEYDEILNDAVMEHLSDEIIVDPDGIAISIQALVDIEGVNSDAVGGSIGGGIGTAGILATDLGDIAKGSVISFQDVHYEVVSHPRKLDRKMIELELGEANAEQSELLDIRY